MIAEFGLALYFQLFSSTENLSSYDNEDIDGVAAENLVYNIP